MNMNKLVGQRIHRLKNMRGKNAGEGAVLKRVGRIRQLVFAPDGIHVVGLLIKRPDAVGMIKRDDIFLALDGLQVHEQGLVMSDEKDATDKAALKRLGLDWDSCIIWGGMDVKTEDGHELGYVTDVRFDANTGDVAFIGVSDGSASNAIVGQVEIPSGMLKGYRDGWMIVDDRARKLELSGGLAGRAGEASAKLKEEGRQKAAELRKKGAEAGKTASAAAEKGAFALGKQIGKTKGMFADFKREFDKHSRGDE